MLNVAVRTLIILVALAAGFSIAPSQTRAPDFERPVAYLTDHLGRKTTIRYADVLIQLALQPGTKVDPPAKVDLENGLQLILNKRILEIPALDEAAAFDWRPSNESVGRKMSEIASFFRSPRELEERLKIAGFDSLRDEDFRDLLVRRLFVDWYIDVHFRRAARPTPEVEEKYYKEIFIPEYRRSHPGLLVPTLDAARTQISHMMINARTHAEIERHLTRLRQRVRIEMVEGALNDL